jgi:hypothetical protein
MYYDRPTRRGETGWESLSQWPNKRTGVRPALIARASLAMSQAADETQARADVVQTQAAPVIPDYCYLA